MEEFLEKECYPLPFKRRGIAIVIVNKFMNHPDLFRDGAGFEIEKLHELFTLMGLEVQMHEEKSRDEIAKILLAASQLPRLETDSMIAIAISSHGCEQGLLGINVEARIKWLGLAKGPYEGNDDCISPLCIRTIFNGENCPALSKKPKILLMNGCRGTAKEEIIRKDSLQQLPNFLATTWSDFITIHSCQPGNIALRSDKLGSLFIDEFLLAYKEYGTQLPLELLLPVVNRKLIATCAGKVRDAMQSCNWESSCAAFLKIPPINAIVQKAQPQIGENFKLLWATATKGLQGPNQMSTPHGLAISPHGQIYIIDQSAQCIWIYTTDGEPMYQDIRHREYKQLVIENQGLKFAWGVCVFENFLFISCSLAITKFCLLGKGLLSHKIHNANISGMDIDSNGILYACERHTCNVILLDQNLSVLSKLNLTHTLNPANDRLMDIKLVGDEMYLLINTNLHTIQVFDVKGTHLRNLVSKGDLGESLFFTIDRKNRCLYAGDLITNELKAFNETGKLMCSIGREYGPDLRGNIVHPNGIDLTPQGDVVVVCSVKNKYMLQSFKIPPVM